MKLAGPLNLVVMNMFQTVLIYSNELYHCPTPSPPYPRFYLVVSIISIVFCYVKCVPLCETPSLELVLSHHV